MRRGVTNRTAKLIAWCAILVLVSTCVAVSTSAQSRDDQDERERVESSVEVLREMTRAEDADGIPSSLLERARAIAVISHVVRGAFIVGGRWGKGVITARSSDGTWGPASFLDLSGASFGFQIGGDATDVILVFIEEGGLDALLEDRIELGANVSVAAGPLGRSAEIGTNVTLDSAIYGYSRSKGLFAGVALDGSVITIDDSANEKAFGGKIDGDVAMSGDVDRPDIFLSFIDTVREITPDVAR